MKSVVLNLPTGGHRWMCVEGLDGLMMESEDVDAAEQNLIQITVQSFSAAVNSGSMQDGRVIL